MDIETGDLVWFGMVLLVGIVWYGGGGGQMTSEFIHEETCMDDWHG